MGPMTRKELELAVKLLIMLGYLLALYLAPGALSENLSIFDYARF